MKLATLKRPALLIALMGILLTAIVSWGLYRTGVSESEREFLQKAQLLATDLEIEMRLGYEALYALYGLFSGSTQVDLEEFERNAADILRRHPEILALEWLPRVDAEERARFERAMQNVYGSYRIWQRGPIGQPEPAGARAYYYPLQYIYPLVNNRVLLGMDINDHPQRQLMLERARHIGNLYVTDPIDLVRYEPPRKGFFALIPLLRENATVQTPEGYVRAVFGIQQLIEQLPERPGRENLRLVVTDIDTAGGYETLYDSHPDRPFDAETAHKILLTPSTGRAWSLLVAPLEIRSVRWSILWPPLQAALLGLLVSGLVATVVHLLQRRSEQIERIVERRTQELNQLNEQLQALSYTDALTGVPNRRAFELAFRREWRRAARNQDSLAIAMVDIDFFKGYNDRFGHPAGDASLQQVAQVLKAQVKRPGDLLARYGGEEFVLLLPHTDEQTPQFGEQCRHAVESLGISNPASYYEVLTISLGMAIARPQPEDDPLALLQAADQALYQAKETGRNRVIARFLEETAQASSLTPTP